MHGVGHTGADTTWLCHQAFYVSAALYAAEHTRTALQNGLNLHPWRTEKEPKCVFAHAVMGHPPPC